MQPPNVDLCLGDVFTVDLPAHAFALVYADPPYANCRFQYARLNKSRQSGRGGRHDFLLALIARMEALRAEDGVAALSMSSNELHLLHMFPSKARVMAWVKPYAPHRPHVWPTYAWEPLVVWGKMCGREEQRASAKTPHDWLQLSPSVPKRGGHETPKPMAFAEWVFAMTLGPRTGKVCELFAGTAPIARVAVQRGMYAVAVDMQDWTQPPSETRPEVSSDAA